MKELKEFTVERLEEIIEWTEVFGRHPKLDECISLAKIALAAKQDETLNLPLDYLQGHKDGLEWAARTAEACNPLTSDWLYDEPEELAAAIRKGPEMPPLNHTEKHMVVPDGWIKCSERMPEDGQIVVIINAGHGEIYEAATVTRYGPHFLLLDGLEASNYDGGAVVTLRLEATHWMLLPAAPKQEV